MRSTVALVLLVIAAAAAPAAALGPEDARAFAAGHGLDAARADALARAFARFPAATQGHPGPTRHPSDPAACRAQALPRLALADAADQAICGGPYMVPLVASGADKARAPACIDQFEFPGLPCAHPVVWATPLAAKEMCAAMGKRLCDAHEWEGACAGSLEPPDYAFSPGGAPSRAAHNARRTELWAYGPERRGDLCAFGVPKSPGCDAALQGRGGSPVAACGSNTFPAGSFPECRGRLPVYDLHGNAAEHMALPTRAGELGASAGVTEMKGSWFFFPRSREARVHPDDCRWREPGWHRTRIDDPRGHANYHLGFRCCKTVTR